MKKEIKRLNLKADYVPDTSGFSTVQGLGSGDGESKTRSIRVSITKFVPGETFAGVLTDSKFDVKGTYGTADLFFFKKLISGTSSENNIVLSHESYMIALDGNVVLKNKLSNLEKIRFVLSNTKELPHLLLDIRFGKYLWIITLSLEELR